MAVPAAIFAPAGAITVGLNKRAENRRKQAAANVYSKKYPLVDNAASMDSAIANATQELRAIQTAPAETKGAKRVKDRNAQALSKWLAVMSEHRRDLQAGLNIASSQTAPAPVPAAPAPAPMPAPAAPIATVEPVTAVEGESIQTAAQTQKKGVNWLLIGGVVVGVILISRLLKK
jgi:hypothetical protein